MNVLRSGLCALALWSALSLAAAAKDKAPAVPPAEPCNFLCGLQHYLSTDHMVASAPEPAADAVQKPKRSAKKPVAQGAGRTAPVGKTPAAAAPAQVPPVAPLPKTATKTASKPAAKPRVAVRASKAPAVQADAQAVPSPSPHRRNPAPAQRSAAWVQPPIPGSAPAITADFSPAR